MDMLVKLYDFVEDTALLSRLADEGIEIRRAIVPDMGRVLDFVREAFGERWAWECQTGFMRQPVAVYIATHEGKAIGFACYEAVCRDFFGPTGVSESYRGRGIGKALLGRCLASMREMGYGYAIIGWVGPAEFYSKCCGAALIEGSKPGVYRGMLE